MLEPENDGVADHGCSRWNEDKASQALSAQARMSVMGDGAFRRREDAVRMRAGECRQHLFAREPAAGFQLGVDGMSSFSASPKQPIISE